MKIHREGFKIIPTILLVLVILNEIVFLFSENTLFIVGVFLISLILTAWCLWFFRDPEIIKLALDNEVLSVADGKVVVIEPVVENEYFRDKRIQISVFMSIFNVHINHIPSEGEIVYQKYHPGKFLPANLAKSSGGNERCTTVIRTVNGTELLVRQIAGILARKIVTSCKAGDKVTVNDQLGFIRFGSRVDVFLPPEAEVLVTMDQTVKGGITVLAKI